ncbi:MAG: ROK family protein, partial [Actinomycetia bacterium]|nr:ROK family protein [Actinomycetes bacterium]
MADRILALDVGGTKIAAGLVDRHGTVVQRRLRRTPAGDAEEVWAAVESLLTETLVAADGTVAVVGVASAGPVDIRGGTVSPINIAAWRRFPLVQRVADVTGLPVRLGGDGLCMALGEWWCGAGRGA